MNAPARPISEESMPAPASLATGQMGMWLFLGTEVMFFAALLATYLILRFSVAGPDGSVWPTPAQAHMNPWIGLANTALLLISSIMVSLAVQSLASGDAARATRFLWVAIALGTAFLGVKSYEYYGKYRHNLLPGKIGEVFPQGSTIARRYDEGPGLAWLEAVKPQLEAMGGHEYRVITGKEKGEAASQPAQVAEAVQADPSKRLAVDILEAFDKGMATPSMAARKVYETNEAIRSEGSARKELETLPALPHGNLWASCYYVITGLHATHLLVGLIALAVPALAGLFGRLRPSGLGYLSNTALYWHFVDLVWIIVFPLLYLV
jgi:cytochrome c oxidase subunit 3